MRSLGRKDDENSVGAVRFVHYSVVGKVRRAWGRLFASDKLMGHMGIFVKRTFSQFSRNECDPRDIISGASTLVPTKWIHGCCDLDADWIRSQTYIDWAQRGLKDDNDYGYSVAISYSKMAICRHIDHFLVENHLSCFLSRKYPEKINVLNKIGIIVPTIVNDFVISERNKLEHDYTIPEKKIAEHALDIAQLAINGISDDRGCVININNATLGYMSLAGPNFKEIGDNVFLFIDVFDPCPQVKLIDPKHDEIRFAKLKYFEDQLAIDLTMLLRTAGDNLPIKKNPFDTVRRQNIHSAYWKDWKQQAEL